MKKLFNLTALTAAAFLALFVAVSCASTATEGDSTPLGETAPPLVLAPPPPPPPPALPPPPPPPPPAQDIPPDTSAPIITVTTSPSLFSPDGDGYNDYLVVGIDVISPSEIYSWHIEIREPNPPYNLFSSWDGLGMPPSELLWDGYSTDGELVQSAMQYHFSIRVTNVYNNFTVYQGTIWIDVLVIREGDILRVIVPAIIFAANRGDFAGLDEDIIENNDRILTRVAEVLNHFDTYSVLIEGHANPTTPPGTAARTNEERGTARDIGLQPLSEERARAVQEYLVRLGVERERLSYVGMGGTRTVVEYEDRDNWWKNRRVEFILVR